ncbi:MAG: hypothetical protein CM1200mP13_13230 [Candidatus Pelagibacterales bacterium]|nr:MAG: hypothetical protein CM1200mP13_13230 [Pelagibacterales bacterium]
MLRPVYTVKNIDTLNQLYHSYYRKFLVGLEYLFFRSGAMTMGPLYNYADLLKAILL